MKKARFYFLTMGILTSLSAFGQGAQPFASKWDNGYKLESADKNFKMKFGGRIMWDNALFFQDDSLDAHFGNLTNGSEFRRIRFFNSGTLYNNIAYKLQFDFAGGEVAVKDAFITIKKIPVAGNFKAGHFKEPFRLETLTSSKYIAFMERSFSDDMLLSRNTGFMFYNDVLNKRLSWQGGIFRRSDAAGDNKNAGNGYAITGRLTGLPYLNNVKNQLLHLGAAYSFRKPGSKEYKVEERPEAHLGYKYISTGTIKNVSSLKMFNLEAALVLNALSFQAEYMQVDVDTLETTTHNYTYNSYYFQVSYFLTGESRPYKSSLSGFSRVKPEKNFGSEDKGIGAWEIALRYSAVDLNSGNTIDGKQTAITAGVNWYLNPATRIMANYVLAKVSGEGNASIFQLRFQLDF